MSGYKLFVAGLATEVDENDLRNIFKECGEILDLNIVRKKTGESRAFGFVRYASEDMAKAAQIKFQGYELKGKKLDIKSGKSDGCLYITGIKKEWDANVTETKIKTVFSGVTKISYIEDKAFPGKNRGYVFVFFESKKLAEKTLSDVKNGLYTIEGQRLNGNWSDNTYDEDENVRRSIILRNLPKLTTEEELRNIFSAFGEIENIKLGANLPNNPKDDIAFVNYRNGGSAERAAKESSELMINGTKVDVQVNKRVDAKSKLKRKQGRYDSPYGQVNPYGMMAPGNPMMGSDLTNYLGFNNNILTSANPTYTDQYTANRIQAMGQMPNAAGAYNYGAMPTMAANQGSNYKTKLCHAYVNQGKCNKGYNCDYAHGKYELRNSPSTLATVPTTAIAHTPILQQQTPVAVPAQNTQLLPTAQASANVPSYTTMDYPSMTSTYPKLANSPGGPTYQPIATTPTVAPYTTPNAADPLAYKANPVNYTATSQTNYTPANPTNYTPTNQTNYTPTNQTNYTPTNPTNYPQTTQTPQSNLYQPVGTTSYGYQYYN